jgi:hypothetical protein
MNARPIYPLPEVVDHRGHKPWEIEPSSAFTPRVFVKHQVLQVPLDATEHSRFLRNHELGHIRWSNPNPDSAARRNKIDLDVLQATEDMRVNTKLQELGVDVSSGAWPTDLATAIAADVLRRGDPRSIILLAVAAQGTGSTLECFTTMFNEHPVGVHAVRIGDMARKNLWTDGSPRFRDTIRVAKWLQMLLNSAGSTCVLRKRLRTDEERQAMSRLEQALKVSTECGTGRRATRKVQWGAMRVDKPPRPLRVPGFIGRRKLATEEGTLPRNTHRLLIDGRVFQRVRRGRGGTVLIDCSGSMSLTPEDIQKILEHSPGASVAVYSGNTRDGVLRILAAGGRQVEKDWINAPAGGANVIDGPALQWLGKQQKPRIWISDGQVTGIHDRMSAINTLECLALCHQHGIVRRQHMADAVTMLTGLRRR